MAVQLNSKLLILRMVPNCLWPCIALVAGLTACLNDVVAQEPAIDRIEYSSLQPGRKASLVAHGKAFKNVRRLALPFVVMMPKEGHDPNADNVVVFEGDVPAEVVPGVYAARLITDQGASASQLVVVDDLPNVALTAESENLATAQALSTDVSVTGQLNAVKPRFFKVSLTAGQNLSVEVLARRLNSELDPVVRVTNDSGAEVAFCDDIPGMQGDTGLKFTAETDGEYVIELRDVKYSGGGRHYFHLRIGDFELGAVDAGMSLPGAELAAVTESEPNDSQETAFVVTPNAHTIHGVLQQNSDVDWFRLTADAATPLCITAHTRDTGSPADVVLQLWSTDGKKLAEADDNGPLDAQLVATLPAAGEYLLRVAELASRGGAEWAYDLEVNRAEGRVEVTLPADRVNVPRGGSASFAATVKRINFDGPLVLEAVGLPSSIVMEPIVLGTKQSTVPITITSAEASSEDANAELGALNLQLTALDRETAVPVYMRTIPPPAKPKAGDPFRSVLARADLFTAVRPAVQFSVKSEPTMVTVKRGESATVALKAERHADWKMEIEIALAAPADQLSPGLTVPNVKIENEKSEATLTITAAADAAVGKCTVFVQGTAKKDKETAVHPVPPIVVEVVE